MNKDQKNRNTNKLKDNRAREAGHKLSRRTENTFIYCMHIHHISRN